MSEQLKKWLDSREFYELMQRYRCAPLVKQEVVIEAFEDVKKGILNAAEGEP
jgi:hypothetical protein